MDPHQEELRRRVFTFGGIVVWDPLAIAANVSIYPKANK